MKSKLVRYPFNDGKRYRWDTYQMGKKFEYSWDESIPQNFETITPYIKAESMATAYDDTKAYALVDLEKEITEYNPDNYQDISGLEWEINETGDYQISEASAVMDDILPLDDIRYVAYVISYARQRDNNSYSGYRPLPSGWQEIWHGNKVYENGEWRTARRELHEYSEGIQTINGVPYSDVLVYHEYSPRGQLIMDVDSNTHELRFYDPDGNLEYTQEFNISARRGIGWPNVPGYPYCYAIPRRTNATNRTVKLPAVVYRDNEETLLTITPQNHEPFTKGEYRWILANQPPINVLLNMLGRAEYQYNGLLYSDYSKCSVEYGRNIIKIHIPTPFLYHKKEEYIRFTPFIYDRPVYDGQGQPSGTYPYWMYDVDRCYTGCEKMPKNYTDIHNYDSSWELPINENEGIYDSYNFYDTYYNDGRGTERRVWLPIYCAKDYNADTQDRWQFHCKKTPDRFTPQDITSYQYIDKNGALETTNNHTAICQLVEDAVLTNSNTMATGNEVYVELNEWDVNILPAHNIDPNKYVIHQQVELIGDQTADVISVPLGNNTINRYTIGDVVNGEPIPKTLKTKVYNGTEEVEDPLELIGIQFNDSDNLRNYVLENWQYFDYHPTLQTYVENRVGEQVVWHTNGNVRQSGVWDFEVSGAWFIAMDITDDTPLRAFLYIDWSENSTESDGFNAVIYEEMIPQPNMIPVRNGNQLLGYYYEFEPEVIYYPRCSNQNYSNGFDRLLWHGRDYISYYMETPNTDYQFSAFYANVFKLIANHYDVETIRGLEFFIQDPMAYTPDGYVYINAYDETTTWYRWIHHITPASSTPDFSHLQPYSDYDEYTDMLIPFRTYVIDEEWMFNYYFSMWVWFGSFEWPLHTVRTKPKNPTWLSYNNYTQQQIENDYHFYGNQWNNIGSPWAYSGNMNQNGDHTMMLLDYSPCPSGTYINALTITDQTNTAVYDTAGNTYSASAQTFYDNIGTLYYFGTGTVVSNNRNTYPDDGRQGLCYYKFHPERTKFIEYTEDTDITINAELYHDRYTYTHDNTYYNRDTSLYNTVIGTIDSTNENSIPNASWRKYYGVYLGDTIPYLNLVEQVIPPADILGVPTYDKQINTSDTLKYGTVASAAISFNMNMPVDEAMTYNNELLILFYDFENKDEWTRLGFFYVDSIEAIDEYTTRITAHDEAYKLNKYVDGFLEGYASSVSLKNFCYQLFTYCGCYFDTAMPNFPQSDLTLDNVYHAVKTTGTEVAHYIASIVPAFIHADIDSDIVIGQYQSIPETIGVDKYTELKYTAYNSDNVNKVKITSNNEIIAEDGGTGENVYYLADNPLINTSWADATLINIANTVKNTYTSIPQYRPATIKFLTLPENIKIGDAFIINTPTNQTYRVLVMRISVDASGVEIESIGTQQFPVEASSTGQFINILNDIEGVSGDVADVDGKVNSLEAIVIATASNMTTLSQNITTVAGTVSTLSGRVDNLSNQQNSTANKVNAMSVSSSNNLATVAINGNTVSQIAMKDYVDTNAAIMKTGVLIYRDDDNNTYNQNVMYIGNRAYTQGIFTPLGGGHGSGGYLMYKVETSSLYGMAYQGEYQGQMFNISFWANLHNHTFTPNN